MAYKLRTVLGKAIYGACKCTVEPVIGIIKEVLGFRQFSLRGAQAAAGEWYLAVWPSISSASLPYHGRKRRINHLGPLAPPARSAPRDRVV